MARHEYDPHNFERMRSAMFDFRQARQQATLTEMLARLRGQPASLLSFEEVRQKLNAQIQSQVTLKDIPLDAIIGSVNRFEDFTRNFLPRAAVLGQRWAGVNLATQSLTGLPPIEAYQIGDVYFVSDGNHRVSVFRQAGMTHIQAYVTPLRTRVPLTPDTRPEDLGRMAEHADFLDETELDVTRPLADIHTSELGEYKQLLEHISVHRYYMGEEAKQVVLLRDAAADWFDNVYLPVIQVVRERGLLQDFPDRTEADIYLWLARHRAQLEEQLGKKIEAAQAAQHLARSKGARRSGSGLGASVIGALFPDVFEPGPLPGDWRREKEALRRGQQGAPDRLFKDILVAIDGQEGGWQALDQAQVAAQRESSFLEGLHVVSSADLKTSPDALNLKQEFEGRLSPSGLSGRLTLADGDVARTLCSYAAWSDLVVIRLTHLPESGALNRLSSGLITLVQRCPRPILVVTQNVSPLSRALLAFDGSPKAREALYVATYLAGQWDIDLTVITILQDKSVTADASAQADAYLQEHGVKAKFQIERSRDLEDLAPNIILTAADYQADFIIMGGYGITPIQNVLRDPVVDQVLRRSRIPVLLCR